MDELQKEIKGLTLDELEKKLFEERESMVEFAESNGEWQLFDDKQSIESMKNAIENMPESKVKDEIQQRFNRVELLYDRYTARVVGETVKD